MTHENVKKAGKYFHGLDTLRGIAILLVMVGHFLLQSFPDLHQTFVSTLGTAGVLLFFYLSGFLIFRNVQTQPPVVFLMRRLFKLFPAYWGNIIVILLMATVFGIGVVPDAKTLYSNIFMMQELTQNTLLNGVYWTLQIEVKFYIVMVVFCYFFDMRWIYVLLALLLATNVALWPFLHRGSTLITYMITFFPGIAAARLLQNGWSRKAFAEVVVVTILAGLNLLVFQLNKGGWQCFYVLIFSVALIIGLNRPLRIPLCTFFAKISYSHYLYHTVIGYALIEAINPNGSLALALVALFAAGFVSVAISTLAFYGLEKPGVMFGRKLEAFLPDRIKNWGDDRRFSLKNLVPRLF